jgi:hypothetical protein
MLLTIPLPSPLRYRMLPGVLPEVFWGVGGLGAEKYRQHVPTPEAGLDGDACIVLFQV